MLIEPVDCYIFKPELNSPSLLCGSPNSNKVLAYLLLQSQRSPVDNSRLITLKRGRPMKAPSGLHPVNIWGGASQKRVTTLDSPIPHLRAT